jgi:hypothetical protein
MPQINSGKSPPWVAGEIVTAAELNGMIDAATLDPSVITSQTNLATLTGDEYALIVDTAGALKKTQLKNSLLAGEDIKTDLISQITGSSAILTIESNPSVAMLLRGTGGLSLQTETAGITINTTASGGSGAIDVESNGMTFDGQGSSGNGVINFQTRTIFSNTGAVKLPVGTTAQRPASPVAGDIRFNSTTSSTETYNGSSWSFGYMLYEVQEFTFPTQVVAPNGWTTSGTTATFTKPANEIWVFNSGIFTKHTGFNVTVAIRYSSQTIMTGNYLALEAVQDAGAGSVSVTRKLDQTWTVPAGTAITAESLSVDAITANGAIMFPTSGDGWSSLSGNLPVSKITIYKYKTA